MTYSSAKFMVAACVLIGCAGTASAQLQYSGFNAELNADLATGPVDTYALNSPLSIANGTGLPGYDLVSSVQSTATAESITVTTETSITTSLPNNNFYTNSISGVYITIEQAGEYGFNIDIAQSGFDTVQNNIGFGDTFAGTGFASSLGMPAGLHVTNSVSTVTNTDLSGSGYLAKGTLINLDSFAEIEAPLPPGSYEVSASYAFAQVTPEPPVWGLGFAALGAALLRRWKAERAKSWAG